MRIVITFPLLLLAACLVMAASPVSVFINRVESYHADLHDSTSTIVLEPWTYTEDFEDRALGAWASYPHWQDLAYDQNFRVNEIVPGDPNISIEQKVTPYTNVDNYAGAQKLLDMYLSPESEISFRYYLKTNLPVEFYKVRFAAGKYGEIDVTIPHPETNKWVEVTIGFEDFVRENPAIEGKNKIKVNALAFLAKISKADPAMPIYFGLDDVSFKGARAAEFQFVEPAMYKLPEFKPYIPKQHYTKDDVLHLSGKWPIGAKKVTLDVVSFTDKSKSLYKGELTKEKDNWILRSMKLSFPTGLYLAKLTAFDGIKKLSESEFTIHIAPNNMAGKHPRLLFDADSKQRIDERFKEERFKTVYDDILKNAKNQRDRIPLSSLIFDLDQFPEEDWLPTWDAWGNHLLNTSAALRWNAMAYAFHGDREAGNYAKNMLVTLAGWPNWTHPWQTKRGRFAEHRTGDWSHRVAEAYDLTYDLMTPEERVKVRKAIMKNIVEGVHRTYVYNNNITGNTSNWIAMTVGGSLMNMAAMYGDGPETKNIEPYFTGAMLKFYRFIEDVTDSKDGAWGESLGYNNYSFSNMSYSVPSLKNVFNIDVSKPLVGTYNEYIWAGIVKDRKFFYFGDNSRPHLDPIPNWAFLLHMRKEPRLAWFYNYLKEEESFMDVLYDTKDIPQDSPFDENPVKVFHEIGTTVFKGGWDKDDLSFVMRMGPFFNHQHLDQGSFWLADRGVVFIEERHGSTYYDDPLYQPWYIQPVAHSTILINKNHQSQRIGDNPNFASGFNDYAFIANFLDGQDAAFSSGDIGRLYWGKLQSLRRNVLFLKPGTLLMLDVAVPNRDDVDVDLLYQTAHLNDIHAGQKSSKITKDGITLNILHLAPDSIEAQAVETPHYLHTLRRDKPLIKEGMLMVSSRTAGKPLVLANLFTSTDEGVLPEVTSKIGEGFVKGIAAGMNFAFSTEPQNLYRFDNIETNALALTWNEDRVFVALASIFKNKDNFVITSDTPATFEIVGDTINYFREVKGSFTISKTNKPVSVKVNGVGSKDYKYDEKKHILVVEVPKGQGIIVVK